jgi:DNA-binding CsgD family transcriptional regulator
MEYRLQKIHQKYYELLGSISFVEDELDYSVLENHRPYLEKLDKIGRSAISVFDMNRKTHVYFSPSYREKLGLPDDKHEGPEGFDQLMHPDDRLTAMESGYYFLKMAMNMNSKGLKDLKLVNDYRIRTPDDNGMRMKEEFQILETDPRGNIWLSLSIVDVSPNQNLKEPMRSRLVNHQTGEIISFAAVSSVFELTTREKEILHHISEGRVSKQIADHLHISVHTVNTHRQNIIEKMSVTNTAEAIRLASRMGILG